MEWIVVLHISPESHDKNIISFWGSHLNLNVSIANVPECDTCCYELAPPQLTTASHAAHNIVALSSRKKQTGILLLIIILIPKQSQRKTSNSFESWSLSADEVHPGCEVDCWCCGAVFSEIRFSSLSTPFPLSRPLSQPQYLTDQPISAWWARARYPPHILYHTFSLISMPSLYSLSSTYHSSTHLILSIAFHAVTLCFCWGCLFSFLSS